MIRCTDSAVWFDFITVECLSASFHSCIASLHFKTDCTADPSQPKTLQEINWSDIQLHFYLQAFPPHGYKSFLTLIFYRFQPNMNNHAPLQSTQIPTVHYTHTSGHKSYHIVLHNVLWYCYLFLKHCYHSLKPNSSQSTADVYLLCSTIRLRTDVAVTEIQAIIYNFNRIIVCVN
jgi:hypothetical protein